MYLHLSFWFCYLSSAGTWSLSFQFDIFYIKAILAFCGGAIEINIYFFGSSVQRGKRLDCHILIGTPGTVMDWCLKLNVIDMSQINVFVLDEADVMIGESGHVIHTLKIRESVEFLSSSFNHLSWLSKMNWIIAASCLQTARSFSSPQPTTRMSSSMPTGSCPTPSSSGSGGRKKPWTTSGSTTWKLRHSTTSSKLFATYTEPLLSDRPLYFAEWDSLLIFEKLSNLWGAVIYKQIHIKFNSAYKYLLFGKAK